MKKNNFFLIALGLGLLYMVTKSKKSTPAAANDTDPADGIGPNQGGGTTAGSGGGSVPGTSGSATTFSANNTVNQAAGNATTFSY